MAVSHLSRDSRSFPSRDDSYFRSLILPYFAEEPLARVNPVQVQKWVSTLVAGDYAPGNDPKGGQLLSAVFDAAVNSDLIPRSPCRGIKLPKDVKEEMRFLSAEEVEQLADATTRDIEHWCSPARTQVSGPASSSD